jgi:hypothetical protein
MVLAMPKVLLLEPRPSLFKKDDGDYSLSSFFVSASFFGFSLGVAQYGLLHLGQTLGWSSHSCRATHSCPHLSHRHPGSVIFATSSTPS